MPIFLKFYKKNFTFKIKVYFINKVNKYIKL